MPCEARPLRLMASSACLNLIGLRRDKDTDLVPALRGGRVGLLLQINSACRDSTSSTWAWTSVARLTTTQPSMPCSRGCGESFTGGTEVLLASGAAIAITGSADIAADPDVLKGDLSFVQIRTEALLFYGKNAAGKPEGEACATGGGADVSAALALLLRELMLEGPVTKVGTLSELTGLTDLTLHSVRMPDLSVLTPMTGLRRLDLKLGGTRDLSLLPAFTQLGYFEACLVWRFRDEMRRDSP
jgi:hypothetical protein